MIDDFMTTAKGTVQSYGVVDDLICSILTRLDSMRSSFREASGQQGSMGDAVSERKIRGMFSYQVRLQTGLLTMAASVVEGGRIVYKKRDCATRDREV